jgi:glycosyltransferase involved in cell wall biosynthesis
MSSDRVRLLKFVTDLRIGGTERQFVTLSRRLDPGLFDLQLACLRRQGDFLRQLEGMTLLDYPISSLHDLRTLRTQLRLARDIRRRRIEIVHTYGFYPNMFATAVAKLAGAIAIASIRDQGDIWTAMQRRVQRWVLRLADAVIVNAEAVKTRLVEEGYSADRIVVIRNGVDIERFASVAPHGKLRRELGLPARGPIVAALCRLHEIKGVEHFLEAAVLLARRFRDARFLVAGDGYHRPALEKYASALGLAGRVIFTGFRHDVPEFLSEVQVSVLPSLSEALSNTLLESMAAGVPVVATRVGGNPEVVEDGVTGFLVPPREPEALAAAISRLLDQPLRAQAMGRAGRQRATEQFSLERLTHETESLYLRLLMKARHRIPEALLARRGGMVKAPVMAAEPTES